MRLRPYTQQDKTACLGLIDGNTPEFFASHEKAEFDAFLDRPAGEFWVVEDNSGTVIGCSGYWVDPDTQVAWVTWTIVERSLQGRGIGRWLMLTCLDRLCQIPTLQTVTLETSQHITGFYERVAGFEVQEVIEHGYAPGLHKVKMSREMTPDDCTHIARQVAALQYP